MELRPYQREAVEAVYRHLREQDDNPVVVIPTGGGKTPVIATICRDAVTRWRGRVLILAHVRELLEQAAEKLRQICPEVVVGVYSAGLGQRDTQAPVIVAGIQSVHRRAGDLGIFDLVLVDEAHLIPPDGDGMYRQFLADARQLNPRLRVVGFTATPFRLRSGSICTPAEEGGLLQAICYSVGVRELIRDGYLCPLVAKAGANSVDASHLAVRGGEFVAADAEELMDRAGLIQAACADLIARTGDRGSCLIFAAGVDHAEHLAAGLREQGATAEAVFGDTPGSVRGDALARFHAGQLKYLVNVNVLTTGFDCPRVDCVALLRPTLSPGLYYQMVGRGFRLHPGKRDCLVLDFAGNVVRHGPVDALGIDGRPVSTSGGEAPAKACPACRSIILAGCTSCPDCGHEFPLAPVVPHAAQAGEEGILAGQTSTTDYPVRRTFAAVHTKRGADDTAPKTLRMEYEIGWQCCQSEWICIEHTGFARRKAEAWWRERSHAPVPRTASEAVALVEAGALAPTESITVTRTAGDYDRITGYRLGDKPMWREPGSDDGEPAPVACLSSDDEPPF